MYNMFTQDGNRKVAAIVSASQALAKFEDRESVWQWTERQLHDLSQRSEYEEAMDTAVRESVYDAVVCGQKKVDTAARLCYINCINKRGHKMIEVCETGINVDITGTGLVGTVRTTYADLVIAFGAPTYTCLLYTSPSPRDQA